jgi:hypothetical protein
VKRHDSLQCRFARRYNYQRALCEDPKAGKDWFKRLKEVQKEHGIQDEDINNFDEIGFAMGHIATTKVVIQSNMPGRPHLIQLGQREWPLQSNALVQQDSACQHALSSKERSLYEDGLKNSIYRAIEELK